ncbi:MAG TPA: ATP-dependent Clp protease proteolytic subunit [Mycobacteriales bacterium]|nr:ATP-dependent Clp protease proteolytic subunit [Mycobacteriales bacterium]
MSGFQQRAGWPQNPPWEPPVGGPLRPPEVPLPRPSPAPWPGMPGAPAALPAEQSPLSQELRERLYERRIVLLTGHLDQPAATSAAAQVMLLDGNSEQPIQLHISCSDGDLDASIMLAEAIDLLRAPVHAVAGGILGGAAIVVYASAASRMAHRHTALQLREPRFQTAGTADQLASRIAQHQHQLDYLYQHVADACGQPVAKVITDMQAGVLLTGAEAVRYGLVQTLLGRPAPTPPAPAADPDAPPTDPPPAG